jgi:hypothetical protein
MRPINQLPCNHINLGIILRVYLALRSGVNILMGLRVIDMDFHQVL